MSSKFANNEDENVAVMLCPSDDVAAMTEQSINAVASRSPKVVFLHIVPVTIKIGKKEENRAPCSTLCRTE